MEEQNLQTPDGNKGAPGTAPVDTASLKAWKTGKQAHGTGGQSCGPMALDEAWQDPSLGTGSHQRGAMGEALMGTHNVGINPE